MGRIETLKAGEFDDSLDLIFENNRQNDDVYRWRFDQPGRDSDILAGYIAQKNAPFIKYGLSDQGFTQREFGLFILLFPMGVTGEKFHIHIAVAGGHGGPVLDEIKRSLLSAHHRGKLRKNHSAHRHQIALALQHSGEIGEIRL